jgi:hypothetical protein
MKRGRRLAPWSFALLTTLLLAAGAGLSQGPGREAVAVVRERLHLLKDLSPPGAAGAPWFADYMRVLERFPLHAERGWKSGEGDPAGGYFGGTGHTELTMRPLVHATLVLALLAGDASYDPRPSGVPAATVKQRAVACLRELVQTHVTGSRRRPSGGAWGDDPQAPWWTGRLALAARLLEGSLAPADRDGVERVLTYEAGRQLARAPFDGGMLENAAAENAWSAEALAWAACLYPGHSQAAAWEEQARRFLMNALSVPQDRADETDVDGRPIREWVTTTNLLPGFFAATRGVLHPCELALPLPSFASIDHAYELTRRTAPQALTFRLGQVGRSFQRLYLSDGRLAYPAGQDGPRNAYGACFLLPGLVLQQRAGIEPGAARLMERGIFNRLEREQHANADGTFFGARFSGGAVTGRRAIFEAETYGMIALAYLLHRARPKVWAPASEGGLQEAAAGAWEDPIAQVAVARAPGLFTSFAWQTLGRPTGSRAPAPLGLFAPTAAPDLSEWAPDQLVGTIQAEGFERTRAISHRLRVIPGGFTTTGRIDEGRRSERPAVRHFVAYAALPEERIAVLLDLALAAQEVRVTRNEGLQLALANDLAGGNAWTVTGEMEPLLIRGVEPQTPSRNRTLETRWLNIAGALGVALVYGQEPFTLRDFSAREQRPTDAYRSLHTELLCTPFQVTPVEYRARQVVRDTAILLVAGDGAATRRARERAAVAPTGEELARAVWITGSSGKAYLVAANFGEKELSMTLKPPAQPKDQGERAITSSPALALRLPPLDTLVIGVRP